MYPRKLPFKDEGEMKIVPENKSEKNVLPPDTSREMLK